MPNEAESTAALERERRAETARRNGRLSRGPATAPGKYRSSLNGVSSGRHLGEHRDDLPAFTAALSVEERKAYVRRLQRLLERFPPEGPEELDQVRALAAARFRAPGDPAAAAEAGRLAARLTRSRRRRLRARATSRPPKSETAPAAGR